MPAASIERGGLNRYLIQAFSIDSRSLAALRVGLAIIMLGDLAVRATDLTLFYSDSGVLPRSLLLNRMDIPSGLCLHLMTGSAEVLGALFVLQGLCALAFLVGYQTRLMTWACWILVTSLQRRNHLILGGGDDYLRLQLFWSLFLPLGRSFSLDQRLNAAESSPHVRVLNWATAALLVQTALVYETTAIYKWRGADWQNGSALFYVLNLGAYARPLGHFMLLFPQLLHVLTRAVLWLETLGPFLLFIPIRTLEFRCLGIALFGVLQLGFYSCMYLDLFPWVSLTALVPFVPAALWNFHRRPPLFTQESVVLRGVVLTALLLSLFAVTEKLYHVPKWLSRIARPGVTAFSVDQAWNLFAPVPMHRSGWFVVPGTLKNGQKVDLLRSGAPLSWAPPRSIATLLPNERRRKYMIMFAQGVYAGAWPGYADYVCRDWNTTHRAADRLESFAVISVEREPLPNGKINAMDRRVIYTPTCRNYPRHS